MPWSNGRGRTRVLATGGPGSDEGFLWRLSLAELDADAGFSALPGIDRVFTLASGGPVALTVDGTPKQVAAGESARFGGESDVAAAVAEGRRGWALNLMTRRGTGAGSVQTGSHHGSLRLDPEAGVIAAMLLKGSAAAGPGRQLEELSLFIPGDQAETLKCDRALISVAIFHPDQH